MLGAHYYSWYGKPTHSVLGGGEWRSGYTDHPLLGEYNSRNPAVINQHITWAKSAGIDFFVMDWTGQHTWEDITLKEYYLSASKVSEIKFCILYDSYFALNKLGTLFSYDFNDKYTTVKTKGQKFLEDFEYLADTYFSNPKYLKIGNRPLVIIYNARGFQNASNYFEQLMTNAAKSFSLFLLADVVYWPSIKLTKKMLSVFWRKSLMEITRGFYQVKRSLFSRSLRQRIFLSRYFDGITGYNMYSPDRVSNFLENVDQVYQKFWDYASSCDLHFIPGLMPGYNDRNLKGLTRPILERKRGDFYKRSWKLSKKYIDPKLKMVLITTFNEWHEGTEIEPSQEYETAYLELTKSFATELKGMQAKSRFLRDLNKNLREVK